MAVSVDTTAHLAFPIAAVLKHIDAYWDELRIGGRLVPGRRPGEYAIGRMPWAVLAMQGRLRLLADGDRRTRVHVDGEIFFLGGLTIPFGIGNRFARSMIRRAIANGDQYLAEVVRA